MSIFIDRTRELAALRERYMGDAAEFLILYGRRRIGKSELIERFLHSVHGIRLLAREESKHLQLKKFSESCAHFFSDDFLKNTAFADWDSFFSYLLKKTDQRILIAIDEFPYLVKEDPSLPSIIQDYWDTHLRHSRIFLVLSGSSISMMEELTMGHGSPLYGRRTGQILLKGFSFGDVLDYVGDFSRAVEFYAVFGGTPAYIMTIDRDRDIFENISRKILSFDAALSKDVEFVLRMELNEPRYYFSILLSIARGNNRIGLIMNDTGLPKGIITKYLSTLIDLQLVNRRIPVTESSRSRKGLYFLSDNLFDFWFRFVQPAVDLIERGEGDVVLSSSIRPHLSRYVGKHFESMVQDLLIEFNRSNLLPFRFEKIGSWWDKGREIDLVAFSEPDTAILFCECKWQDGVHAQEILEQLKEKAASVAWNRESRQEYYLIVARSFFRRCLHSEDRVLCLDAEELACMHREAGMKAEKG
ncbi:MAG TPA: ATP-binding protein [Methanoregulaceae archaeon]|nr:ATP-binding protein [Methanoregulaceae archaeon]